MSFFHSSLYFKLCLWAKLKTFAIFWPADARLPETKPPLTDLTAYTYNGRKILLLFRTYAHNEDRLGKLSALSGFSCDLCPNNFITARCAADFHWCVKKTPIFPRLSLRSGVNSKRPSIYSGRHDAKPILSYSNVQRPPHDFEFGKLRILKNRSKMVPFGSWLETNEAKS